MKRILLIVAALISTSAIANSEEKQILDDIIQSIEKLKQEVVKAKQYQADNKRIKVQYQHIYQDLSKVQAGILATQEDEAQEPRVIEPIKGDYLAVYRGSHDT